MSPVRTITSKITGDVFVGEIVDRYQWQDGGAFRIEFVTEAGMRVTALEEDCIIADETPSGTVTAAELVRNDRVILDPDDMPHLVDSVTGAGDTVHVVFSSGEERVFRVDDDVMIVS